MKKIMSLLIIIAATASFAAFGDSVDLGFAHEEVYEANSDDSNLAVTWTIEPMVFEKEYVGYFIANKKNAQLEGQVSNQTACIRKKGQLIGKTILHKYEVWDAGIDRKGLTTRIISICKFPEIK